MVWFGKSINLHHLKVFGCRAFVHIPKDERNKLDPKSRDCIFLGYGHEEFGYRLWDPNEKKIIRSRDVIFFENQTIEDVKKENKNRTTEEIPVKDHPFKQVQQGVEVPRENIEERLKLKSLQLRLNLQEGLNEKGGHQ